MVLILRRGNVRHQPPGSPSLELGTSILSQAAARKARKKVCAISALCAISPFFVFRRKGRTAFRFMQDRARPLAGQVVVLVVKDLLRGRLGALLLTPNSCSPCRPSGPVGGWDLHDDIDPDCEHLVSRGFKYVLGMAVRERGGNPGSEKIGLESRRSPQAKRDGKTITSRRAYGVQSKSLS